MTAGAELFVRFLEFPHADRRRRHGHAIAAGAVALLAADARIGASGAFKIGLSEVASGMTLPAFAIELARNRLSKRHFHRATNQAALYSPEAAVDVGYLDRVEAPDRVVAVARAEAERLGSLAQPAFGATKQRLNRSLAFECSRDPRRGPGGADRSRSLSGRRCGGVRVADLRRRRHRTRRRRFAVPVDGIGLEPTIGFEPMTCALRMRCSTS